MKPASESLLAAALPGVISNPVVNAISNLNLAPQDVAPPLQNGVDIPEFGQVISNLGKLAFDDSLTIANRLQGTGVLGRLGRLPLEILDRVLDTSRLLLLLGSNPVSNGSGGGMQQAPDHLEQHPHAPPDQRHVCSRRTRRMVAAHEPLTVLPAVPGPPGALRVEAVAGRSAVVAWRAPPCPDEGHAHPPSCSGCSPTPTS